MNYLKTIRFHFFALIFIALLVVFTYWSLPNTFFQQDEWLAFSRHTYFINKGITGVIESLLPIASLSHFNPFAAVFSWFNYVLYKTNFTLYAWQSIALHVLNVLLVYYFAYLWFKSKKIAFIAALFFGVNSMPHQAVTWVIAANSYEIPTLFILVSLIFFQKFLVEKDKIKRNIIISLSALFISLLFHENGIFLLSFYPIIFFLYGNKEKKKLLRILSYGLVLLTIAFFLVRLPFFFGLLNPIPEITDISRPPITVYPYRAISIALKSFAGSLIPEKTLIDISEGVVRLTYPQFLTADLIPNPFIAQSIVFDLVSYFLTILIICVIVLLIRFQREKKNSEALIWSFIFVPLSVLPYAFVLGKAGYASIFEPKFLYVPSIGISVLFAVFAYWLLLKSKRSKLLTALILFCLVFYVLFHVYQVKSKVNELEKTGMQRKAFLTSINSSYPNLPQKVVFFIKSDTTYYGMPDDEKILPVQVGFGKMLMIWYQKVEKFPGCLYENNFLLPLLAQGYKECGIRSFGYFRDYDKLVATVQTNNIKPEEIIAFSWNGNEKSFTDITKTIREKLSTRDRKFSLDR